MNGLVQDLRYSCANSAGVTHSEANAAYGSRTIQLHDGWMVCDTSNPELQPFEAVKQ